jgi:hypothetical protein
MARSKDALGSPALRRLAGLVVTLALPVWSGSARAAPELPVIRAAETVRLPLLYAVAPDLSGGASVSAILGALSDAVREETDLLPVGRDLADRGGQADCAGVELVCAVDASLTAEPAAQLVWYVAILSLDGRPAVVSRLLDRPAIAGVDPARTPRERKDALLGFTSPITVTVDPADPGPALRRLVRSYRDRFDRFGHWAPYASLELSSNVDGAQLTVDERTVGTVRAGTQRVEQLRAGTRRVGLGLPGYDPVVATVELGPGDVARLDLELSRSRGPLVDIFLWGGVGLIGAGAAVSAVGAVAAGGRSTPVCIQIAVEAPCPRQGEFVTTGGETGGVPNPPGLAIAPFGFALAATGLGLVAGSWLGADLGEHWWWISALSSLAVGAGTYGLAVALDGPNVDYAFR